MFASFFVAWACVVGVLMTLPLARAQTPETFFVSSDTGNDMTNTGRTATSPLRTLGGVSSRLLLGNASVTIFVTSGVYTQAADCAWSFACHGVCDRSRFELFANGTEFQCDSLASNTQTAAATVENFAFVTIVGARWSRLRRTCDAGAASCGGALTIQNVSNSIELDNVQVFNVSVVAPSPDASWRSLASPVVLLATTSVTVSNSHFVNNALSLGSNVTTGAELYMLFALGGGALAISTANVTLVNATFAHNSLLSDVGNQAMVGGGALFLAAPAVGNAVLCSVTLCDFINNTVVSSACAAGGAIVLRTTHVTGGAGLSQMFVSDSSFVQNSLLSTGLHSVFMGACIASTAVGMPGSIYPSPLALTVDNTSFANSSAAGPKAEVHGGVLRVWSISASSCDFEDNVMSNIGSLYGGLMHLQGVSTIRQCRMTNNSAHVPIMEGFLVLIDDKDGHDCTGSATFALSDSTVTGNVATSPDACAPRTTDHVNGVAAVRIILARCEEDVINFQGITFVDNALWCGSGAFASMSGGDMSFNGSFVRNNVARNGAVFFGDGMSSVDIDQSTFVENVAVDSGGVGKFVNSAYVAVHNCQFVNNSANGHGGAFLFETVQTVLMENVAMSNCTDAQHSSVWLASLQQLSLTLRGNWTGNDVMMRGPIQLCDVAQSVFIDSAVVLTCEVRLDLDSARVSFATSRFRSNRAIVIASSSKTSTSRYTLEIVDCIFELVGADNAVESAMVQLQSPLFSYNVHSSAFIGTQDNIVPLSGIAGHVSIYDSSFFGTVGITLECNGFALHSSTFKNTRGAIDVVGDLSIYDVRIDSAREWATPLIRQRSGSLTQISNLTIADSSCKRAALSIEQARTVLMRDILITNTTAQQASSIIALDHVICVLEFTRVELRNNTFGFGAIGISSVDQFFTSSNVTLADNHAQVAAGAVYMDYHDVRLLTNLTFTSERNRADCFGPDVATTPQSIVLLESVNGTVSTMLGVPAQITVQLHDAFRLLPDCSTQQRDTPMQFTAFVDSFKTWQNLCTIDPSDNHCVGYVVFDAAVGESVELRVMTDGDLLNPLSATVQLEVIECLPGFALLGNNRCMQCQMGTYAFGRNADACKPCPQTAMCAGGSDFQSDNDTSIVWSGNGTDVEVHRCLPGACMGGVVRNGTKIENWCVPGRVGLLCASCNATNSVPVAPSGGASCVECPDGVNWPIACALFAAVFAAALVLHHSAHSSSAKVKLTFYFAQIAPFVLPADFQADVLLRIFNVKVSAATAAFGGICVANLDHFDLTVVKLTLPLAIIAALLVMFGVVHTTRWCVARRRRQRLRLALLINDVDSDEDDVAPVPLVGGIDSATEQPLPNPGFWGWCRFRRTFFAVVLLTYSVVLKAALDVLDCRDIGSERVLRSDVRIPCTGDRYWVWSNVAKFVLLPYLGIVLIAVPTILYFARRRNGGTLPRSVALGALYDIYKPEVALGWEFFVLLRRLSLGLIDILMPNSLEGVGQRFFVLNIVNSLSLAATLQAHPLQSEFEHWLDVLQLAWLIVLGNNVASLEVHPRDAIGRPRLDMVENGFPLAVFVSFPVILNGAIVLILGVRAAAMFVKEKSRKK